MFVVCISQCLALKQVLKEKWVKLLAPTIRRPRTILNIKLDSIPELVIPRTVEKRMAGRPRLSWTREIMKPAWNINPHNPSFDLEKRNATGFAKYGTEQTISFSLILSFVFCCPRVFNAFHNPDLCFGSKNFCQISAAQRAMSKRQLAKTRSARETVHTAFGCPVSSMVGIVRMFAKSFERSKSSYF